MVKVKGAKVHGQEEKLHKNSLLHTRIVKRKADMNIKLHTSENDRYFCTFW